MLPRRNKGISDLPAAQPIDKTDAYEERVTIKPDAHGKDGVSVWLDGELKCLGLAPHHAEIYRLGLIAKLRESQLPGS